MSLEERDVVQELESPIAGEEGLPVDAKCVDCGIVRAKRVPGRSDPDNTSSFRHVCHNCQTANWWNVIRVLDREVVDE